MFDLMCWGDRLVKSARRLARDDAGATSIEYTLMASLIALACIASFNALGVDLKATWDNVANKVAEAMTR
jgi:pilus assembly protein Flp/PilA